jgi:hypothetical protein
MQIQGTRHLAKIVDYLPSQEEFRVKVHGTDPRLRLVPEPTHEDSLFEKRHPLIDLAESQ